MAARKISLSIVLTCLAALANWGSVWAQMAATEPMPAADMALLERLEAAEARLRELERAQANRPAWFAGYNRGFIIRPSDAEQNPYELRINGRIQFRHVGFARDIDQWVDNAGVVRPVMNRNDFEIERGRLEFRGFFHDPNLQFYINLDADTDDKHVVIFHDFWMNYKFSDALDVYIGKAFVPGSRDWLSGSTRTRFTDRSMATTFFRPDRTLGIWVIGEPRDNLFYRVMVGNGFNTTDLTPSEIDTRFVYSGSMWAHLGDYGDGYSDLEWHEEPAAQIGHSFTFASDDGRDASGRPLAEENFVRLSDGTRLTQTGALAPGVTVDHFEIYLYTVDAAFKYRGFSANAEYFFRWLRSIRGDGPLPLHSMYDNGFYAEAGYFLIPERFEIIARLSQIYGAFGDAQQYAGGFNWFVDGTHNRKLTFEAAKLNHNPANNSGPNLRAGDDGLLFQTQLQLAF
ncbi:MAG: hypothetical protein KatS3mg110_0176 [Pirellulaceae bacterium]|nr:MAG: hypothetical protein KatS3mg110_0176 [Pirellulaceae bacterium]